MVVMYIISVVHNNILNLSSFHPLSQSAVSFASSTHIYGVNHEHRDINIL